MKTFNAIGIGWQSGVLSSGASESLALHCLQGRTSAGLSKTYRLSRSGSVRDSNVRLGEADAFILPVTFLRFATQTNKTAQRRQPQPG